MIIAGLLTVLVGLALAYFFFASDRYQSIFLVGITIAIGGHALLFKNLTSPWGWIALAVSVVSFIGVNLWRPYFGSSGITFVDNMNDGYDEYGKEE